SGDARAAPPEHRAGGRCVEARRPIQLLVARPIVRRAVAARRSHESLSVNPFRTTSTGSTFAGAAISVAIEAASVVALFGSDQQNAIGREVAVPIHLEDGQEFSTPLDALLKHGKLLFEAVWTDQ